MAESATGWERNGVIYPLKTGVEKITRRLKKAGWEIPLVKSVHAVIP